LLDPETQCGSHRLAVYWAQWNLRTLNRPEGFSEEEKYAEIDFQKDILWRRRLIQAVEMKQ
jgi:hypothetical protein